MEISKPLAGKNVLITRTKAQSASFAAKISEVGGNPIEIPLIITKAPEDTTFLNSAINQIDSFDWIVFTSVNGVAFFLQALREHGLNEQLLASKKIAVVGRKTAQFLNERDILIHLQPCKFVAEAFLEELLKAVIPKEKVLFPRGNLARDVLEEGLSRKNIHVQSIVTYETSVNYAAKESLVTYLSNQELDIVTFTSPSTIHAFMELLKGTDLESQLTEIVFACIGPITEKAISSYVHGPLIVAQEYTTDGLLEQLIDYYKEEL